MLGLNRFFVDGEYPVGDVEDDLLGFPGVVGVVNPVEVVAWQSSEFKAKQAEPVIDDDNEKDALLLFLLDTGAAKGDMGG